MRITLAAALCLAASLCAPLAAEAKPLTVCTEASPDGFDVVQYNSLVTTNASADVIFNGLVAFDESSSKVVPALADKWTVSPDGLTYTFHLRPNVQFQSTAYFKPSRPLDADDVLFTFGRMLDPNNPWHKVSAASGFPHAQSLQLGKLIKAIDKNGEDTVVFHLSQPDATFLSILTMGFASIYPAEYAQQLLAANRTADLNSKPIGTGPFVLHSYQRDALIRYDANPHYWGPKPKVDRLLFEITPDAAVRMEKVKAGECDIALSPMPTDVQAARSDNKLKIVQTPAFMTAFVAINTQHKPFDNVKVRQAINLAFDRTTYLKAVFSDTATPAVNPYPPNTWSYAKDIKPYPHDVAQAKKLMAEAGYPNGFDTTIWVRPTGSTLNPDPKTGSELLQADLAQIGIRAKIDVIEWGTLIRDAKQGQHDLLFMGWAGDDGDPDNFLTPQFACASIQSGLNFARYCNPELDHLISDAKATNDLAKRTQDYEAAQKIIHDQALWLPLAYPTATALTRQNVTGFQVSPFGRVHFDTVAVQ